METTHEQTFPAHMVRLSLLTAMSVHHDLTELPQSLRGKLMSAIPETGRVGDTEIRRIIKESGYRNWGDLTGQTFKYLIRRR